MDRSASLMRLARKLERATASRDWRAVDQVDRELAKLVQRLADGHSLSDAERVALEHVHRTHDQARKSCARELERIGTVLAEAQKRREGCVAYALSSDWRDEHP